MFAELAAAEETLRRGKEQPTGRLRVDVPGSFGRHILLPALPEFLARYPGIDLELRFNERVVDIVREGVDLAVRAGTVTDPNVVAPAFPARAGSPAPRPLYLARHGRPQSIEDLAQHVLIGSIPPAARSRGPGSSPRTSRRPPSCGFGMTVNEAEAVMLAAARGVGIAQTMDLLAARELVEASCVIVLPEHTRRGRRSRSSTRPPRNAWRGCGFFPISCAASASTSCSARRPTGLAHP